MKNIEEAFSLLTLIICDGRLDYTKEKIQLSSVVLQDAKQQLSELKANLKSIEWAARDCDGELMCPACQASKGNFGRHSPDCWLDRSIKD